MRVLLAALLVSLALAGCVQRTVAPVGMPVREADSGPGSNLEIGAVLGDRPDAASPVATVRVRVMLAPGAFPLDLSHLVVRHDDGRRVWTHAASAGQVGFDWLQGDGAGGILRAGDVVEVSFAPPGGLAANTVVRLTLDPAPAAPATLAFTTPFDYGARTTVALR